MIDPQNPDYRNTPGGPHRPHFLYKLADHRAMPVVSIVTPYYNTGLVFSETAQSIMQQSLQQWEWIIVNDGSTKVESLKQLDAYRQFDSRIRVIDHLENRGLPAARNTGSCESRSKYLLFLDSDDLLEPTAAEKWFWFLEGHLEYAFVSGFSVGFGAHEYLWQSGFQDKAANLEQNLINHVLMMRKDVWNTVGGYDETMQDGVEDWEFWLHSANQGYWGSSIPEYLHWYRTRPDHADRWGNLKQENLETLHEQFRQKYPQLWEGDFPDIKPYVDLQLLEMEEKPACENRLVKDKPRLLLIAPWMIIGGAEKFNLDLMKQFTRRGWEVTIATTTPSNNPWQHEFERFTPDVFALSNFLEVGDNARFLHYLIQSRQPDALLLSASPEGYRLLPYLRQNFPDLPILDYLHFITPDWMNGGFPRLSLLFNSSLDMSVVTSEQLKNWMVAEGADKERVRVCTANVDVESWHPDRQIRKKIRKQLGIDNKLVLILYIGRIEKQKQPRVFANTMLQLRNENLPFLSLVVGDGSLKGWLEAFVNENHLEDTVRFIGAIPLEQVRDLMVAGDIVFLPSENEGISLIFYEGMACGLTPVGADVGGQRELVTDQCGVLLPRGSEEKEAQSYAHALAELIRDPEKRAQKGLSSRERVAKHFTVEQMGERMETLVHEARRMRKENPQEPTVEELTNLLTRQSMEYLRVMEQYSIKVEEIEIKIDEIGQINQKLHECVQLLVNPPMPPAPASTYLYFAVRQLLYPILGSFMKNNWLERIKIKLKSIFVRQ